MSISLIVEAVRFSTVFSIDKWWRVPSQAESMVKTALFCLKPSADLPKKNDSSINHLNKTTMKRNSFFDGHAPSFKSLSASSLAGLMSLASVGAYASTKSAAEGEVNTPVEALIPMAQDYVANNNIDADSSLTINTDKELNALLSGTLSSSIQDLTSELVSKRLAKENADKIFTTFMTTNNPEQAKNNTDILNAGIKNISETYDNISTSLFDVLELAERVYSDIGYIEMKLNKYGDDLSDRDYSNIKFCLQEIKGELYEYLMQKLDNFNSKYKAATYQNFPNISEQKEFFSELVSHIEAQIDNVENKSIPVEQAITEVESVTPELEGIINVYSAIKEQYANLKENDVALLKMLLQKQTEFNEDGKSSAEEQAASKDLLNKLVENATPMTRNYIITLAKRQYKPENDPTGIEDVNTSAKVDRNVYKTATEIYRLDGQSVTVYDYSGKLLRTEPLDLKIHSGFAQ